MLEAACHKAGCGVNETSADGAFTIERSPCLGLCNCAPAVNVTIMARDAESFRQSRTQVASDIARAVSLGRRGM